MNTALAIAWALSGFVYMFVIVTLIICLVKLVTQTKSLTCDGVGGHCICSSCTARVSQAKRISQGATRPADLKTIATQEMDSLTRDTVV